MKGKKIKDQNKELKNKNCNTNNKKIIISSNCLNSFSSNSEIFGTANMNEDSSFTPENEQNENNNDDYFHFSNEEEIKKIDNKDCNQESFDRKNNSVNNLTIDNQERVGQIIENNISKDKSLQKYLENSKINTAWGSDNLNNKLNNETIDNNKKKTNIIPKDDRYSKDENFMKEKKEEIENNNKSLNCSKNNSDNIIYIDNNNNILVENPKEENYNSHFCYCSCITF